MICDSCHGTGWVRRELREPIPIREEAQGPGRPMVIIEAIAIRLPCPECGGSGRSHSTAIKKMAGAIKRRLSNPA